MLKSLRANTGLLPYSLYDFANSSFTLIIHAYLFPLYFKNVLFHGSQAADAIWGSLFSISVFLAVACAPFLGKLADGAGRYWVFLLVSLLSFISTYVLAFSVRTEALYVMAAFIAANTLFYIASNVYDSLLTIVAPEDKRVVFSGFAWGFGYVGGIACFLVVYLIQGISGIASPWPYAFTATFYLTFGLISVISLRKYVGGHIRHRTISLREMLRVLDKAHLYLLAGYWLIADVISTIILFTAIYGSNELRLSDDIIGVFLLFVQLLAFPSTYIVARLAGKVGLTRALTLCVVGWIIVIAMLVIHVDYYGLVVVAILTSLVIGSTQALMRAQYSLYLEDKVRTSEIFGWYAIATESSSVVAPVVFGGISALFGSQRLAMGLLTGPLVIGIAFIWVATNALEMKSRGGGA